MASPGPPSTPRASQRTCSATHSASPPSQALVPPAPSSTLRQADLSAVDANDLVFSLDAAPASLPRIARICLVLLVMGGSRVETHSDDSLPPAFSEADPNIDRWVADGLAVLKRKRNGGEGLFFQAPLLRKRQACRPFLPFLPPQLELEALEDMADTRHLQSGSRHALVCTNVVLPIPPQLVHAPEAVLHSVVGWLYSWSWPAFHLAYVPRENTQGPEDVPFDMDRVYTDEYVLERIGDEILECVNGYLSMGGIIRKEHPDHVYDWVGDDAAFRNYDPEAGFSS